MRGVGGASNIIGFAKQIPGAPAGVIVSGTTRDSSGAALGGCTVLVFETDTNVFHGSTISASDGTWSLNVAIYTRNAFYAVYYLIGSPDRAGTTLNTLAGV